MGIVTISKVAQLNSHLPQLSTIMSTYTTKDNMIDELTLSVSFTGKELYETIKLYDTLRDMDFELTDTQVEVFEKLQDAEVNGGFF